MRGRRLGSWSLRADAVYCLLVGATIRATAPAVSTATGLPPGVVIAGAAAVILWAAAVAVMERRLPIRLALRVVMVANLAAVTLIVSVSALGAALLVVVSLLAIAADVGGFALSQYVALRRIARAGTAR